MNRRIDQAMDMGIGAGLMYLFDSKRGKKRRARLGRWAAGQWFVAQGAAGNAGRKVQMQVMSVLPTAKRKRSRRFMRRQANVGRSRQILMGSILPTTKLAGNVLTQASGAPGRAREVLVGAALAGAGQASGLVDRARGLRGTKVDGVTASDAQQPSRRTLPAAAKSAAGQAGELLARARGRAGAKGEVLSTNGSVKVAQAGLPDMGVTTQGQKGGSRMTIAGPVLVVAGIGAALAYFLRQSENREAIQGAVRRIGNRARGIGYEAERMTSNEPASDLVLVERVREALGHAVSHPGSIEVTAQGGRVTLSGPVLAREVDGLLARVRAVPDVTGLDNQLQVFERPDGVPGLQGRGHWSMDGQSVNGHWGTGMRLLVTAAGGILAATGIRSRGVLGSAGALLGLGLLALGVANYPVRRLFDGSSRPQSSDFPETTTASFGSDT